MCPRKAWLVKFCWSNKITVSAEYDTRLTVPVPFKLCFNNTLLLFFYVMQCDDTGLLQLACNYQWEGSKQRYSGDLPLKGMARKEPRND